MNIEELQAIVAVSELGSQSAAARALNLSRTTLRRRLQALEARTGLALAHFDGHSVTLSPAARPIVRHARRVLAETDALLETIRRNTSEPRLKLRLATPEGMPPMVRAAMFRWMSAHQPDLCVEVDSFRDPMSCIGKDYDVIVHFGSEIPPDPWESFPIATIAEVAVASPAYLDAVGRPTSLADLQSHRLLSWQGPDNDPCLWPTADGGSVEVRPSLVTGDLFTVRTAAALGCGVAMLPVVMMQLPDEPVRRLEQVLPGLLRSERSISLIAQEHTLDRPKIQAMLTLIRSLVTLPESGELAPNELLRVG